MACYKELVIPVNVGGATFYNHRLVLTDAMVQSSQATHNGVTLVLGVNDATVTITYAAVVNYASLIAFQNSVKTLLTDSTLNSVTLANQTVSNIIVS